MYPGTATDEPVRASDSLTVSVVVPTFKRPDDLRRCLRAIEAQTRQPDQIIVIVRDIDLPTWAVLRELETKMPTLRAVTVRVPGQVQALNAALDVAETDIFAITDDDAAPHSDWLGRIVAQFSNRPDIAGVGGRDYLHVGNKLMDGRRQVVGKVPSFRSHIGNHHLGYGSSREVDILKGVNGSYRTSSIRSIRFDERLRGTGAQVHWEISLGLTLKRAGWKLIYDPAIAVDHFLAPRFDEDQRHSFNELAQSNMSYNEALIRLEHLSSRGIPFMLWAVLVGSRALPGLVQAIRFLPSLGFTSIRRFVACQRGRFDAWEAVGRS